MIDYTQGVYNEVDPDKKDNAWANKVASIYRMYWRYLVSPQRISENRAIMYGTNIIQEVKDSFKDKKFIAGTQWLPLPILEALVNAIVEEITQQPPRCEIRALDPLAVNEKESDLMLLKNRRILEQDVSKYQQDIGLPAYKVPYSEFNGNVQEFDEMQLDENDPEDMSVFKNHFHRLWSEIGLQAAVNAIVKLNKFDDTTIRTIVKDIFAVNTVCTQAYVDQITGQIVHRYIDPGYVMGIFGESNDGRDDVCRGWYKNVTVWEWLSMAGNDFDFDTDWQTLLWAINFCNNKTYTGFIRNGSNFSCLGCAPEKLNEMGLGSITQDNLIQWSNAYMFKLNVGYLEWWTNEATSTFKTNGNDSEIVNYSYELSKEEQKKGYEKKSNYQIQWYRQYFLATSSITQYTFGFQKIYFQHLEGMNDEYSNGTLCYYQEQGQSAVELSRVFLRTATFSFYRFLWLLWHTKPLKKQYLLDELRTLASAFQEEVSQNNSKGATLTQKKIEQLVQMEEEGMFELRVLPRVEGRTLPTLFPDGRKQGDGGADPTAIFMQAIIDWARNQIERTIGFNPMRFGANPPSRESLKTEQNTVQASQNATGYMYRMVEYLKKHLCISTMNYICDIMQYPDTLPYNYLKKLLGDNTFNNLKQLKKDTPHLLGIFVDDVNLAALKRDMMTAAQIALGQKEITLSQYYMLGRMEDPKMASARLEIMQRQAVKRAQRQLLEIENVKKDNALAVENAKAKTASIPAQAQVSSAQIGAQAQIQSASIQAKGRVEVKELQNAAEPAKQDAKAQKDKEVIELQNNLKQQQPLTGATEE